MKQNLEAEMETIKQIGTEKPAGTSMQLRPQSGSSKPEIVKLLTKFAERRQAQVNPSTLLTFADDLASYQLRDIEAGLKALSSVPRAEGETAFPEVARVELAIGAVIRDRRTVKREAAENRDWEARKARVEAERQDQLSDPVAWNKMLDEASERIGLGRKKIIDTTPVMQACPHCSRELPVAPNIRFWSVKELRGYADVLEGVQATAAANREAYKAEQERLAGQQAELAEGII